MFGRPPGVWEIVLILAVIVLIFGGKKLPELARAVGKSVVELKDGLRGKPSQEEPPSSAPENKQ
jgi:sec-independent protein translocase protein TatA